MYFEIGGGLPRLPRLPTLGVSLLPLKVKTRARARPALRISGLGSLGSPDCLGITGASSNHIQLRDKLCFIHIAAEQLSTYFGAHES